MANERCPDCGASYAMVGYRHRCIKKSDGGVGADTPVSRARKLDDGVVTTGSEGGSPSATVESFAGVAPGPSEQTSTYRYRDPEKRRAQMAVYMRGYRARRKHVGEG